MSIETAQPERFHDLRRIVATVEAERCISDGLVIRLAERSKAFLDRGVLTDVGLAG
jgi:hypothetical protein